MTFDNREKGHVRAWKGAEDETLLMATRRGLLEHSGEAEPVLIARDGTNVVLTLEDGEQIELDALELTAAIKPQIRLAA